MRLQETDSDKYPINPEHDPRYNPDIRDVTQPPEEARDIGEWYNNPDVRDITRPETWCDGAKNAVGWILGLTGETPRQKQNRKIREIQKDDPLPSQKKEDGTKYYDRDEGMEWGKKKGLNLQDEDVSDEELERIYEEQATNYYNNPPSDSEVTEWFPDTIGNA